MSNEKTKTPFWEESYKRKGMLDTFGGGKPSELVVNIAEKLPKNLKALDLGCGEGRNAIYLANMGFVTSAVDISESGIEKLNTVASEKNLKVASSVCDMRKYNFPHEFDFIVCKGCLHLINRNEWKIVLENMKKFTTCGGYHIVDVFTDTLPEPDDQRGLMIGLFKEGELFEYYRDWEIIQTKSFNFKDTHPGGISHEHSCNAIIVRKPESM